MATLPPADRRWKNYKFPKMTGGLAGTPRGDQESFTYTNLELMRDGTFRPRAGIVLASDNSLGSAAITGVGFADMGNPQSPQLFVAKVGTTMYHSTTAANTYPVTFSSFTIPFTCQAGHEATIVPAVDKDGNPIVLIGSDFAEAGSHLVYWDGSAAHSITTSPPASNYFCLYNGRCYMFNNSTNQIHFSDTGNVLNWPSTNNFQVTTAWGQIKRLVALNDRILIIVERGILYMVGDPTGSFYIGTEHVDTTGLDTPGGGAVAVYGNHVVIAARGHVYDYNGDLRELSDSICPFVLPTPSPSVITGCMTPYRYVLRTKDTDNSGILMVLDRVRTGQWAKWAYPTTSGLGNTPSVAMCHYHPYDAYDGVLLSGADGNLYIQQFYAGFGFQNAIGNLWGTGATAKDAGGSTPAVRGTFQTPLSTLGTDTLTAKQVQTLWVQGYGANANVTVTMLDTASNIYQQDMLTGNGTSLPFNLDISLDRSPQFPIPVANPTNPTGTTPVVNITTGLPDNFIRVSITLSADNLSLEDLGAIWRAVGYGPMQNLP